MYVRTSEDSVQSTIDRVKVLGATLQRLGYDVSSGEAVADDYGTISIFLHYKIGLYARVHTYEDALHVSVELDDRDDFDGDDVDAKADAIECDWTKLPPIGDDVDDWDRVFEAALDDLAEKARVKMAS
jgi:hypothetical protein